MDWAHGYGQWDMGHGTWHMHTDWRYEHELGILGTETWTKHIVLNVFLRGIEKKLKGEKSEGKQTET